MSEKDEVCNFRIDLETMQKFDQIARAKKRSRSKHICWLIEKEIREYAKECITNP